MLGRPNHGKLTNIARHRFNDWLRQGWTISPLFDLAASEATRPDGSRETFTYRGATAENLVAAYTDDGGHLNADGRRAVAAAFLRTLAAALRSRR
jgi:lysophospholipase L1-like esterase